MDAKIQHEISVYLTENQLQERIAEIGADITKRFEGETVVLICILKGSVLFFSDLAKRIQLPMTMEFMRLSSYGAGTSSSGKVDVVMDLGISLTGQNVIVVEDIIDSGNTLSFLQQKLKNQNPKTITICTLLDKPSRREAKDIVCDYTGFVIPDKFVVGYGLDYDQRYRNLPYIGFIED
jgi:hypoxanthine phosphoribosyltransferase